MSQSQGRSARLFFVALMVYLVSATVVITTAFRSGSTTVAVVALAIVIVPLVGFRQVWRDLTLRRGVAAMAATLAAEAALVTGDGAEIRVIEDKPDPKDWRSWYAMAGQLEAEDDHRRARAAMRHALSLYTSTST